jgi:hypothetical protein
MPTSLYLSETLITLNADTVIELTLQVNDVSEAKDRQGNFSNQFTIPMTKENRDALESAELISTDTTLPYTKIPAKVIRDGVEIQNGYGILEQTGDDFEITVYSGNKSFFETIEGQKLSDLSLFEFDFIWNKIRVLDRILATDGILYPLVDLGNAPVSSRTIDVHYLTPWIFVSTLIDKIFDAAGWAYSGAFIDSDLFSNLIISLPTLKQKEEYLLASAETSGLQLSGASNFIDFDTETNDPQAIFITDGSMQLETVTVSPGGTGSFWRYKAHGAGKYSFSIFVDYAAAIASAGTITVYRKQSGVLALISVQSISIAAAETDNHTFEIEDLDLEDGDAIMVRFTSVTSNLTILSATFECTKAEAAVTFNHIFPIAENLPDMSQTDFIKAILQIGCITVQPVPFENELRFVQFSEIIANKPLALDWSDKVDYQEKPVIEYHNNSYAQENWLRYKPDDTVSEFLGDGSFAIADETLAKSKTLLTLPFAASEMTNKLAGLNLLEYLRIDGSDVKAGSARIAILAREALSSPVTYTDGSTNTDNNDPENLCYFILDTKTISLGFGNNLIATYYPDFVNTMNDFKRVTLPIILNQVDISELDHFIPIYIEKYAQHFYLNKISSWIDGRSAKCSLVKI